MAKISKEQSERIVQLEDKNNEELAAHAERVSDSQKDLLRDMDDRYRELQDKYDNLGKHMPGFSII